MQKWEYAVLSPVQSYGLQYRVNGEKQGQWKDKEIHVVLADMGKAGFEMIVYDGTNYIFKRPIGPVPPEHLPEAARSTSG